ncbi:hypothetical protein BVRB_4g079760 [Beta vulgaris subsp. vulgaris]|nr:hypothetical protein BVRB_4g079760 [Beta vulgaris subsp. vulgaris]
MQASIDEDWWLECWWRLFKDLWLVAVIRIFVVSDELTVV